MAMDNNTEEVLKKCCSLEAIKGLSNEEIKLLINQASKNDRLQCHNDFLGKNDEVKFFTFNLPRIMTCPGRTGICSENCYQEISENMIKQDNRDSQVLYSRKLNWFLSTQEDFVDRISKEINKISPKPKQKIIIRIHASGDFYSEDYLEKWMKIALITKLSKKNYEFVAYTKSYCELDNVLSDQERLHKLYEESYKIVEKEPLEKEILTLADFNIHIIASYMDDTDEDQKRLVEKWELPIYFVTDDNNHKLVDCEVKACTECLLCYTFPMNNVYTRLR